MLSALYFQDRWQDSHNHNSHHILWCRKKWNVGYNKKLRDHPYMKVDLPIQQHNFIHRNLDSIPPPDPARSKEVLEILNEMELRPYIKNNSNLISKINLLLCIWGGYKDCQETCDALREQKKLFQHYDNPL